MFTGITQGLGEVIKVHPHSDSLDYRVAFPPALSKGLQHGASVSIDGVCQSVIKIEQNEVDFNAISITLQTTTLKSLGPGRKVSLTRSACLGEEVGGHLLTGHICDTIHIVQIKRFETHTQMRFQCAPKWTKYLFNKGYVALDGASLTLVDVDLNGYFGVHFIPQTLSLTPFQFKKEGDPVNLEIDSMTQLVVDSIERFTHR